MTFRSIYQRYDIVVASRSRLPHFLQPYFQTKADKLYNLTGYAFAARHERGCVKVGVAGPRFSIPSPEILCSNL